MERRIGERWRKRKEDRREVYGRVDGIEEGRKGWVEEGMEGGMQKGIDGGAV